VISKEVTMSEQERVSWVSLVVNLVIGYWYFGRVFSLPASADLFGPGMGFFAIKLVTFAIIFGIVSEVVLRAVQRRTRLGEGADATTRDERDDLINLKATRNAHGVLVAAIIVVLAQIAMLGWGISYLPPRPAPDTMLELMARGPLAPMHLAQLLLLALTLAAITVYASRIVYYRRGY
jgi:hypothetical protein